MKLCDTKLYLDKSHGLKNKHLVSVSLYNRLCFNVIENY